MAIIAGPEEFIGDDKTPSIPDVQSFVCKMIYVFQAMLRQPPSTTRLVNIHNAYTFYVLQFLSFSTGYRGVKSPFQDFLDYDHHKRILLISDKDDIDGYMTHIAYVPEKLALQFQYYHNHCQILLDEIELSNPSSTLINAAKKNIFPKYIKLLESHDDELAKILTNLSHRSRCFPFLFFLSERKEFKEVRPLLYLDWSPVDWLRGDSGRHFFRSSLVWNGCSTEVIDAAMGHWAHGNEPYGPYSCLSTKLVCKEIKQHVDPIVDTCGWRAIKCLS